MDAIIKPSKIGGIISAPPSKSLTHRAIILASLARGNSIISNPLLSEDTRCTINACQKFGTKIDIKSNKLEITGTNGHFPRKLSPIKIFCGLSGTTMRLITAVAGLNPTQVNLTGDKRLLERPIGHLIDALKKLGIDAKATKKNFPPIKVKGGNLRGGKITISGDISSQFISALLIISPFAKEDMEITVQNLQSAPYVDITIDVMKKFGVEVIQNKNSYFIKSGQKYKARNYEVEGDYSSASYLFAAASITHSKVKVKNLNPNSVQGDKFFLDILKKMNDKERHLDLGNYPDLVPTVSVIAASQNGTTTITHIGHLRLKESDRINAIAKELTKMGKNVHTRKDSITIDRGRLIGATIETHNDHRLAMSFAIAGLVAEGKTIIKKAEVVNKSYPNFWKDLIKIGANVKFL